MQNVAQNWLFLSAVVPLDKTEPETQTFHIQIYNVPTKNDDLLGSKTSATNLSSQMSNVKLLIITMIFFVFVLFRFRLLWRTHSKWQKRNHILIRLSVSFGCTFHRHSLSRSLEKCLYACVWLTISTSMLSRRFASMVITTHRSQL